jgi:hypothetical protein
MRNEERPKIETPYDFKSMHTTAMTLQPHYLGHTLPPPLKGRDVSVDTEVELVFFEHSCKQVEFKTILLLCYSCYFSTFWLY